MTKFILDKLLHVQVTSSDDVDLIVLIFDYLLKVYMLDQWEETDRNRHIVYTRNYSLVKLEWTPLRRNNNISDETNAQLP